VRGGIPVCWPWFGPHASESSYPANGIARNLDWELIESGDWDAALRLVPQSAFWPHPSEVECRFTVGHALEVELVTRNTGKEPFTLGCALHTYFSVSDARDIEVLGLENVSYIDKVGGGRKIQQGPVKIDGEVDRIYVDTASSCVLVDPGLKRIIRIEKRGSNSTVIWNPGCDKAEKMGDVGNHLGMLCIETCNAADDVVTVLPGQSHSLWTRYSVEKQG
jgi:glucose-6-phosphate 1-epimerase